MKEATFEASITLALHALIRALARQPGIDRALLRHDLESEMLRQHDLNKSDWTDGIGGILLEAIDSSTMP